MLSEYTLFIWRGVTRLGGKNIVASLLKTCTEGFGDIEKYNRWKYIIFMYILVGNPKIFTYYPEGRPRQNIFFGTNLVDYKFPQHNMTSPLGFPYPRCLNYSPRDPRWKNDSEVPPWNLAHSPRKFSIRIISLIFRGKLLGKDWEMRPFERYGIYF